MASRGVKTGPMSYSGWNDGDPGLTRAIWCLIHHLAARQVVETGVAHGVTSRFVLEALQRNDGGRLWSIDVPPLLQPEFHQEIGVAVPESPSNLKPRPVSSLSWWLRLFFRLRHDVLRVDDRGGFGFRVPCRPTPCGSPQSRCCRGNRRGHHLGNRHRQHGVIVSCIRFIPFGGRFPRPACGQAQPIEHRGAQGIGHALAP